MAEKTAPWAAAVRSTRSGVLSAFDDGQGRVLSILSSHRATSSRWAKSTIDTTMVAVRKELATMQKRMLVELERGAKLATGSVDGKATDLSADTKRLKAQVSRMEAQIREILVGEARQIAQTAKHLGISKADAASGKTGSHLANGAKTTFSDRLGRKWKSRTYFDLLADATTMNAGLTAQEDKLVDSGHNLVVVSGPSGGCDKCRPWVGRVLAIVQDDTHPSLSTARGNGLFHPRCRHFLSAYQPKKKEKEKEE